VQLHRARSDFEAAGVPLVLIGQATPRHAAHFRRRQEVDLPVLADEQRDSYRAAGAKVATVVELLGPKSVGRGLMKSVGSGGKFRQGKVIGHPAQLGGAMIVKPDGTVPWTHMSEDASDNAPPEEILAAARQASTAG
jgi:peroxiredoxin